MSTEDNIFVRARKSIKSNKWGEPITQTALGKRLGIKQQTVAKAENGQTPSYNTIKQYHEKLHIPYASLFGESDSLKEKNVTINQELKLSDEAINTLRNLPPNARTLLDAFLSSQNSIGILDLLYVQLLEMNTTLQHDPNGKYNMDFHFKKQYIIGGLADYLFDVVIPKMISR